MSRRVNLPAADDLFRPTADQRPQPPTRPESATDAAADPVVEGDDAKSESGRRRPSGRIRHDEKMTVYVTSQELLDIEQARLHLRALHGVAVDRGRLVREALAIALADLDLNGEESVLVARLRDS